jgi:hypothetical protein
MHRKSNKIIKFVSFFENYPLLNNTLIAGAASRYGPGSDQMMRLRLRNTAYFALSLCFLVKV